MESEPRFEDVRDYIEHCVQEALGETLSNVESQILQFSWEGLSYGEMAELMTYGANTLKNVYGYRLWKLLNRVWPTENINKSRFKKISVRLYRDRNTAKSLTPQKNTLTSDGSLECSLYSRLLEIIIPGCRSVVLTGAKGSGKKFISRILKQKFEKHFAQVIYHTSNDIPTWKTWHQSLCSQFEDISVNDKSNETPFLEHQLRSHVLQVLSQRSCLMIVEQGERFLDNPKNNELFNEIARNFDQKSCFLWITDIEPGGGIDDHISVEVVDKWTFDDAKKMLLKNHPHLTQSLFSQEVDWQKLVRLCGGNPDLLDRTVRAFRPFYGSQIYQILANLSSLPTDLVHIFEYMVEDVSDIERNFLYLLAFQPLSWVEIEKWPKFQHFTHRQRFDAWAMLNRRHLLETPLNDDGQQKAITPHYLALYLLHDLKNKFEQEFVSENFYLFHCYPIILPNAPFWVQYEIHTFLVDPLIDSLRERFSTDELKIKIGHLMEALVEFDVPSQSCAAGNLLNMATYMGIQLSHLVLTGLTFWHADLRVGIAHNLDIRSCCFQDIALDADLGLHIITALHPSRFILALGDSQGIIRLYRWSAKAFELVWVEDVAAPIQHMIMTGGGKLIVATSDKKIRIWENCCCVNARIPDLRHSLLAIDDVQSLTLSADDKFVAISLSNNLIQYWRLPWENEGIPLFESLGAVDYLTFSPDAQAMVGYDCNQDIYDRLLVWHWDARTENYSIAKVRLPLDRGRLPLSLNWLTNYLDMVEVTIIPGGHNSSDLRVDVRRFTFLEETIETTVVPLSDHYGNPCIAAFSHNGDYLVICSLHDTSVATDGDYGIQVWQHYQYRESKSITLADLPNKLEISNDGRFLVCQGEQRISLWDLEIGQCVQIWQPSNRNSLCQSWQFTADQGLSELQLAIVRTQGARIYENE